MNRLFKISFLSLRISSIVFIIFFITGMFVALVLKKNIISLATFWDVLVYTILLNIAMHLYRKSILAGEQPGKVNAVVLGALLGPLIFFSSLNAYKVASDYFFDGRGHIGSFILAFLIFSTLAASGIVLFIFVIQNQRRKSVKDMNLPAK